MSTGRGKRDRLAQTAPVVMTMEAAVKERARNGAEKGVGATGLG
jgi:hypothetical protein